MLSLIVEDFQASVGLGRSCEVDAVCMVDESSLPGPGSCAGAERCSAEGNL